MALSTTCPQCRTRFRVTPVQLQQRAGRVRCGICRHAFDALEELDELDDASGDADAAPRPADPPRDAPSMPTPPVDTGGVVAAPATRDGRAGIDADDLPSMDDVDTEAVGTARSGGGVAADLPGELPDAFRKLLDAWPAELDWPDARTASSTAFHPAPTPAPAPASAAPSSPAGTMATPVPEEASGAVAEPGTAGEDGTPEAGATVVSMARAANPANEASLQPVPMLRQPSADADALRTESVPTDTADLPRFGVPAPADGPAAPPWRRPLLMALLGLLVLAALLQAALLGRHALAAREPALRPALQALAGAAGLRVELPRRLSQLTLEGFDLQATGPEGRLALTAVLRNRANVPVQWPALELTLTDEGGGVVVRRALLPVEYLRGSGARLDDGMPARSELPVRMLLDAPLTRSAGYAVDLFYP